MLLNSLRIPDIAIFRWIQNWNDSAADTLDKGLELALKAVEIDDRVAIAHAALCWAYIWQGEHDKAIAEGRLAIDLDPDDVLALERLALSLIFASEAELSLPLIAKARRLNPSHSYDFAHGVAMFMSSRYGDAIEDLKRNFELNPDFIPSGLYLAASHALAGNQSEAEATVTKLRQVSPSYHPAETLRTQFKKPEDRERFFGGLRQAGLTWGG